MAALESVRDLNLRLGIQYEIHLIKLIKSVSYFFKVRFFIIIPKLLKDQPKIAKILSLQNESE